MGWPDLFQDQPLVPRVIDFSIVSWRLLGCVAIEQIFDVPRGPHIGLQITINRAVGGIFGRQVREPSPLPDLVELNKIVGFVQGPQVRPEQRFEGPEIEQSAPEDDIEAWCGAMED